MECVRLGLLALKISRIRMGCMSFGSGADWMLTEDGSRTLVRKTFDLGVNFFDTADAYSSRKSEVFPGRSAAALHLAGSCRTGTVRSHSPMARDRFNRQADGAVIDAVAVVSASVAAA